MRRTGGWIKHWMQDLIGAGLAITVGLGAMAARPFGQWFEQWSYDLPYRLRPDLTADAVIVVSMDAASRASLAQRDADHWDRQLHARLLDHLLAGGARAVVFITVFFEPSSTNSTDRVFAQALRRARGRGVLAAEYTAGPTGRAVSWDRELTGDDTNTGMDLFIRNLNQGSTQRVVATNAATQAGFPALSADGRYVAYLQSWTNILWNDLATGTRKLVEEVDRIKPSYGTTIIIGPLISPNGRFVAYSSHSWAGYYNVFRRDMWSDPPTRVLVSTRSGSDTTIESSWAAPMQFSSDGKWLAFVSTAWLGTNLVPPAGNFRLYAHHLGTRTTRVVASAYLVTNGIFTADSRYLFFHYSPEYSNAIVQRHDLLSSASNLTICENCWNPSPDAEGRWVAVQTFRWGISATNDVFVVDSMTGQSNLVSVNLSGTGGGNGNSYAPLMSYDGRYVVFTSRASDLVPNDNNNAPDVFVRDLHAHTTMLVSRNIEGTGPGNRSSHAAVMSADGRVVFFQSFANDLTAGDYNQVRDIYSIRLGGPDTDATRWMTTGRCLTSTRFRAMARVILTETECGILTNLRQARIPRTSARSSASSR